MFNLEEKNNVIDVSDYPDMADILLISDALITDYSSSAGDAALLGIPVVLFIPQKTERPLYFDLEESPYYIAFTQDELEKKRTDLNSLLTKYNVASTLDLISAKKNVEDECKQLEKDRRGYASELKKIAGGREIADIQAEYEAALKVPTRSQEVILEEIGQLTPEPVGTFISLCEHEIDEYKKEYLSQDENVAEIK